MSSAFEFSTQFYVKIHGAQPPDDFVTSLQDIKVENSLHLPDLAVIRLQDPKLHWIDQDLILPGTPITIEAKVQGETGQIFDGEIVELIPEFSSSTQTITIRAFDRLHRLARGTHVKSFLQVTDGDVAQTIAGSAGLSCSAGATPYVHKYLLQNNQSHLEFLNERASDLGFIVWVQGQTLHFDQPPSSGTVVSLEWGKELIDFNINLSTIDQVGSVTALGWDPSQKQAVTGQQSGAQGGPSIGLSTKGGAMAERAFGSATTQISDIPFTDQSVAQRVAQGDADRREGQFITADGSCIGNPHVVAGAKVQLSAIGTRFSGSYLVTSCTHEWSSQTGYTTAFSASGYYADTLVSALAPDAGKHRTPGLVIGLVTDNNDPDTQGRVKVKFPWLSDTDTSNWARVCSLGAGATRGIQWLPEVNDEVLVGFDHGDINFPYVLGGLWNGLDNPAEPSAVSGGKVMKRVFKTRAGHIIIMDDTDGGGGITIQDVNGNKIVIDAGSNNITITVQGDAKIEAQGNLSLQANGQLNINGTGGVKIQSSANVDVTGTMINLN